MDQVTQIGQVHFYLALLGAIICALQLRGTQIKVTFSDKLRDFFDQRWHPTGLGLEGMEFRWKSFVEIALQPRWLLNLVYLTLAFQSYYIYFYWRAFGWVFSPTFPVLTILFYKIYPKTCDKSSSAFLYASLIVRVEIQSIPKTKGIYLVNFTTVLFKSIITQMHPHEVQN